MNSLGLTINRESDEKVEPVDLISFQESDSGICKVKGWIEAREAQGSKEISSESYFVKALVCQFERLEIHEQ